MLEARSEIKFFKETQQFGLGETRLAFISYLNHVKQNNQNRNHRAK